ncbi:hypothetical protein LIA77_01126 [Sarocladium implicatum]|nr:hypothetical protein LIA77_01126 [Sarocladium implicatum]
MHPLCSEEIALHTMDGLARPPWCSPHPHLTASPFILTTDASADVTSMSSNDAALFGGTGLDENSNCCVACPQGLQSDWASSHPLKTRRAPARGKAVLVRMMNGYGHEHIITRPL